MRDREASFLVEGAVSVREALTSSAEVVDLFVSDAAVDAGEITTAAKARDVAVWRVTDRVAASLADTTTPQGVVAVVRSTATEIDAVPEDIDLALVLAEVRDPGNAGTLLRSAAAARAGAVVFTTNSVDPFSAKTVRASAGALFHTRIVRDVPLERAAEGLRSLGLTIVGADARSERSAFEADLSRRVAFVVGNEAWGLTDDVTAVVDEVVGIPMPGAVESLNVAIAGSVLLFEAVRRRSALG